MGPSGQLTLRSVAPSAFLPALVYEIGNGAVLPVVALTALDLGASVGTAGYLLTLLGIGQVLGNIPSFHITKRLGDRRAMLAAALVAAAAQCACAFAVSLPMLGAALFVVGVCNSTFYLARQTYVQDAVPATIRARALSTLAGAHRIGLFLGPFLGAVTISWYGIRAAYVVAAIAALAVVVLLRVVPEAEPHEPAAQLPDSATAFDMVRRYGSLYLSLGAAVVAVGAVRAGRQTVLPLWAAHIGLDVTATSIVFGIANAIDMALFYPAGYAMDRWGRRVVAIPSMLLLGGGTMLVALTSGVVEFALAACLVSVGNGIGSGIMMTLGSDSAPQENRTAFLSVWRGLGDSGNALGPVAISVLAATTTLVAGVVLAGVLGILAAAGLARWAPRYSAHWRAVEPASSDAAGPPAEALRRVGSG